MQQVGAGRRRHVLRRRARGRDGHQVEGDPVLLLRPGRAHALHREAVAEQQVVGGSEGRHPLPAPRRVPADGVAEDRAAERLVEGDPLRHPVTERGVHDRGVVGEALRGVAQRPTPRVLEGLRQVPVVEGRDRLDARCEQLVHQPVVERQPRRVDRPGPGGLDPGPGDREAVGVHAEVAHQGDVLPVPVVVVARDVAGVAVHRRAGRVAVGVPDRGSAAVDGPPLPRSGTTPSRRRTGSPGATRGRRWDGGRPGCRSRVSSGQDGSSTPRWAITEGIHQCHGTGADLIVHGREPRSMPTAPCKRLFLGGHGVSDDGRSRLGHDAACTSCT